MAAQIEIPGIPHPEPKQDALAVSPMSLMQMALETGKADQLQILQDMYFKDLARKAEIAFNLSMNTVQQEIGWVAADCTNPQTRSKYASYEALDGALRGPYTRNGFSLSFSTDPSVQPEKEMVRVVCHVSHRAGHTRMYYYDMPADGKGAKGGDVMTKTHARASAGTYGMRYLLKMIFNIAIGEDDDDGNGGEAKEMAGLDDWCTKIADASDYQEMREAYDRAFAIASEEKNQAAKDALINARNAWRKKRGMK